MNKAKKVLTVISSFLRSVGNLLKRSFRKEQVIASPEKADSRLRICEECPEFTCTRNCKICLCFMDAKVYLEGEKCPLKKW